MAGQKTDARDVHVGQRIAEQRKRASLTQKRVAQSFGMSAAQLQKYEKGINRISAIHLEILSRMTGMPITYFFDGMDRSDDIPLEGFAEPPQQAFAAHRDGSSSWIGLVDVVAAAAGTAPAMLVRGAYTAEILARNGYASTVIGCPSLFLSPTRDLGARIAARVAAGLGPRPAIAAGHQHHADMAPEHRLIAAAERDDGCYVVQHPATMIALARSDPADMQSAEFAMLAQRLLPGLTPAQVVAWGRRRAFVFTDSQNWMSFLRRYDYAIGPRFHGVALAIQAERPGVVLHVDSRTREMAETMAIPTRSFDDAPRSDLRDVVANAWTPGTGAAFDTRRATLARVFRTALEAHDITVSARLAALGG